MSASPNDFETLLARTRANPPMTQEDQERLEAARAQETRLHTQRTHEETWDLVSRVTSLLMENHIAPEKKILEAGFVEKYRDLARWGLVARESRLNRMADSHNIGAWDTRTCIIGRSNIHGSDIETKRELYIDTAGSVYGVRGMSEREWSTGILIPELARSASDELPHEENYTEVRQGLANLVVLHGIDLHT